MFMDMFENIIENIDEDYPFSLSPSLPLVPSGKLLWPLRGPPHVGLPSSWT